MSWLVRLYPPSWRKRYGGELEGLVEDMPGRLSTALDLLVGAAIAYRDVIHANRVLSTAAAYLHGLCVAVLLQAIVFVSLVMVAQGRNTPTAFSIGPVALAAFVPAVANARLRESLAAQVSVTQTAETLGVEVILLLAVAVGLAMVLSAPRLLRALR